MPKGGRRVGAGRPSLGVTRKISVTLRPELWDKLDSLRSELRSDSYSDLIRYLVYNWTLDPNFEDPS